MPHCDPRDLTDLSPNPSAVWKKEERRKEKGERRKEHTFLRDDPMQLYMTLHSTFTFRKTTDRHNPDELSQVKLQSTKIRGIGAHASEPQQGLVIYAHLAVFKARGPTFDQ